MEKTEKTLLEELAALEHDQWGEGFAKPLSKEEPLSPERLKRWSTLWNTPYNQLPEKEKEKDRKWSRKVLVTLAERIPPTQMNPSRVERLSEQAAICFLLPLIVPLGVNALLSLLNRVLISPVVHTILGWLFFIGFFGLLFSFALYSDRLGKRQRHNDKVLFLRKFLEVDTVNTLHVQEALHQEGGL